MQLVSCTRKKTIKELWCEGWKKSQQTWNVFRGHLMGTSTLETMYRIPFIHHNNNTSKKKDRGTKTTLETLLSGAIILEQPLEKQCIASHSSISTLNRLSRQNFVRVQRVFQRELRRRQRRVQRRLLLQRPENLHELSEVWRRPWLVDAVSRGTSGHLRSLLWRRTRRSRSRLHFLGLPDYRLIRLRPRNPG